MAWREASRRNARSGGDCWCETCIQLHNNRDHDAEDWQNFDHRTAIKCGFCRFSPLPVSAPHAF